MSEQTTQINWSQLYTDKATEIEKILSGLSQQDIRSVLLIFENRLPSKLTLPALKK